MDRGFLDGAWITHLKEDRKIGFYMPLKTNSEITQFTVVHAATEEKWMAHPTHQYQRIYDVKKSELDCKLCQCFNSGVLVNFTKKNGKEENFILFLASWWVRRSR